MCNSDIISLKYTIITQETWQILLVILFFSLLFTVFLVAACWIKLFCHIQEVLAGCSWGGSYVVLCIHLGSWSTLFPLKIKIHGGGLLAFAFCLHVCSVAKKTTCALTKSVSMDQTIIFHQNYIECGDNWYEAKRKFFCVITFGCNITISVNFHLTQH